MIQKFVLTLFPWKLSHSLHYNVVTIQVGVYKKLEKNTMPQVLDA